MESETTEQPKPTSARRQVFLSHSRTSAAAATAAASNWRNDHLRDLLSAQKVGKDDRVEGSDFRVASGLEQGVDLLGRDVGLSKSRSGRFDVRAAAIAKCFM